MFFDHLDGGDAGMTAERQQVLAISGDDQVSVAPANALCFNRARNEGLPKHIPVTCALVRFAQHPK